VFFAIFKIVNKKTCVGSEKIMALKNNDKFKEKLKHFWRRGDEVVCTRVFRNSNNECYFCGNTPIERHHVLLNTISNQIIDVEFSCVILMKKMMEEIGSSQKILFFPKYTIEVDHLNNQYQGTADIIEFICNIDIIRRLISNPKDLSYKQVRSILDYTIKFEGGTEEEEIFHAALDLYLDRKYYVYEMIDDHKKTNNVKRDIENYFREEWEKYKYQDDKYYPESCTLKKKNDDCPF